MKAWLITALALASAPAIAGGRLAVPPNAAWQAECASCHIAYAPQLLPAASWQQLMSQLDRHFGTDASLDPASAAEITRFLESNAASGKRARGVAGLRITEAPWFVREHHEVAQQKLSACESCHTTAAQGDFRERNLKIQH
jgi:hypothetical protein